MSPTVVPLSGSTSISGTGMNGAVVGLNQRCQPAALGAPSSASAASAASGAHSIASRQRLGQIIDPQPFRPYINCDRKRRSLPRNEPGRSLTSVPGVSTVADSFGGADDQSHACVDGCGCAGVRS